MIARLALLVLAQGASPDAPQPLEAALRYPFGVGESLQFSAKLGFLRLGTGTMEVARIDTVRGTPSFHFRFALEGGNALYRINSVLESWTGVEDLKSRRFSQDNNENGRIRERDYEIFPDSGFYRLGAGDPLPTPEHPLDDASFIYFIRTQALEVGREYRLDYYFRKEKNPLIIKVEKRERMDLPDGTKVQCLVVRPIMGDRGIFARRQDARVWITDDARRIPVQIRTRYPFGTVTLRLEKMTLAEP